MQPCMDVNQCAFLTSCKDGIYFTLSVMDVSVSVQSMIADGEQWVLSWWPASEVVVCDHSWRQSLSAGIPQLHHQRIHTLLRR